MSLTDTSTKTLKELRLSVMFAEAAVVNHYDAVSRGWLRDAEAALEAALEAAESGALPA